MYTQPSKIADKIISLHQVKRPKELQQRAGEVNQEYIDELLESFDSANEDQESQVHPFAPIRVVWDGETFWLFDGFYRTSVYEVRNVPAINAEVYSGTYNDALIMSYGVNDKHGLRRTADDKRKAVKAALKNPDICDLPSSELAKICGTSRQFVWRMKQSLTKELQKGEGIGDGDYGDVTEAEIEAGQGFTEAQLAAEMAANDGSDEAWVNSIPALAAIKLRYGNVPNEAKELAKTWKALSSVGVFSFLKSKKRVLKNININNDILRRFHSLNDVPEPSNWGICPSCLGSYHNDISGECMDCHGGVVMSGGIDPQTKVIE